MSERGSESVGLVRCGLLIDSYNIVLGIAPNMQVLQRVSYEGGSAYVDAKY